MGINFSNDRELLSSLSRGDMSAYVKIYSTYYDSLLNYADRILNDFDTAKDVVQQVYYKIWEKRDSLNIETSVKAYLLRSVYNESLNTLAHKKNIQKYEQEQLSEFYLSTIIQLPEAEIALWQSDIEQAIQKAITVLPKKCREVFVLSKMKGLKNREIAEKLNISPKTVERHMSIALSKLRVELEWLLKIILFFSYLFWG